MSERIASSDKFWPLLDAACDGHLAEMQVEELAAALDSDPAFCEEFAQHIQLRTDIHLLCRANRSCDGGLARVQATLPHAHSSAFTSPAPGFFSTTLHTTLGYFSEGMPLAYLLATVIVGVGLLIGSRIYVSGPDQVAWKWSPAVKDNATRDPQMRFVGRITGMVDCQWAGSLPSPACGRGAGGEGAESSIHPSSFIIHHSSPVSIGDRFALSSGLMEITYDTGAKVILQGPVTYEVESPAGGYLSIGKLTAKLEKKSNLSSTSGRGAGGEGVAKADSPLSTLHSPLFAVRTPTATVTDLGTEFGVEVDTRGRTVSHVFRGSVEVQVIATDGETPSPARVLHEKESVIVNVADDTRNASDRLTVSSLSAKPGEFVRKLAKPTIGTFDLVDVVAGGDGFSGRRNRGIDPTNGQSAVTTLKDMNLKSYGPIVGNGKYHRVETSVFVDGVFIPDSHFGAVQVDSAGHTFADFGETDGMTGQNIWAGGTIPVPTAAMPSSISSLLKSLPPSQTLAPTELGGIDYAVPGRGLIFMHANSGITFDLEAIRRANPGVKLLRFRATAGNVEPLSEKGIGTVCADLWALVDGRVRFRRREITGCSGAFPILVPVAENDRFLTLATTDSGNSVVCDWILFGDPVLEMLPAVPAKQTIPKPK